MWQGHWGQNIPEQVNRGLGRVYRRHRRRILLHSRLVARPLTGAAIGEFIARKDTWQAGKVGIGTFIGFIIGTVAKIGCALTIAMTILFVWLASLF